MSTTVTLHNSGENLQVPGQSENIALASFLPNLPSPRISLRTVEEIEMK